MTDVNTVNSVDELNAEVSEVSTEFEVLDEIETENQENNAHKNFKIPKVKENKVHRSLGEKIVIYTALVIFILYAITMIFPIAWAFMSSLKAPEEIAESSFGLPKEWLFANYIQAFQEYEVNGNNMITMILNSLWLTFAGTFVGIMVSSATAYIIAKYPFWGTKIIFNVAIFTMVIPIVGSLPSMYDTVTGLGLDNPIGIIALSTGGFGMNFIILHGFYRSVSWTYAEAAFIDGANDLTVYFKIIFPQALPSVTAMAILSLIGGWNDFMTPLLYLPNFPTLALGIYQFDTVTTYQTSRNLYYCAIILSIIPILVIFCCFQDMIMQNTVAGGLKG